MTKLEPNKKCIGGILSGTSMTKTLQPCFLKTNFKVFSLRVKMPKSSYQTLNGYHRWNWENSTEWGKWSGVFAFRILICYRGQIIILIKDRELIKEKKIQKSYVYYLLKIHMKQQ